MKHNMDVCLPEGITNILLVKHSWSALPHDTAHTQNAPYKIYFLQAINTFVLLFSRLRRLI